MAGQPLVIDGLILSDDVTEIVFRGNRIPVTGACFVSLVSVPHRPLKLTVRYICSKRVTGWGLP